MIAPDGHVCDVGHVDAGLMRELGPAAILIEARHREPTLPRNRFRVVHRDQAIRVARIANDKNAHISRRMFLDGLTLSDKNSTVGAEQLFALHTGFARNTADEQGPVHVAETLIEIGGRRDSLQERGCAILQFHDHAFEGVESRWDFDQMQGDGLFRAEHRAGCHAKNKRVPNLASGPGDRDFNGRVHFYSLATDGHGCRNEA